MSRILIVEDEHALAHAMALAVRRMGHEPETVGTEGRARQVLSQAHFDAVVLDIGLPDRNGVELLKWVRKQGSDIPVLVVTAHATLDYAIASQKLGVADYLIKPLDLMKLEQTVAAMVSKGQVVHGGMEPAGSPIIGASASMHPVLLGVARACAATIPVLICGPVGSGKSLATRVIHSHRGNGIDSLRAKECGRLATEGDLSQVLANPKGTVVLENLADLGADLQFALSEFLAGSGPDSPAVIGTLRQSPEELLASGKLREDLYYAFNSMIIRIPPLAERTGDIPALSRFFTALSGGDGSGPGISVAALEALQAYSWPGNVRELRHVVEHAVAMSHGQVILPGHLPPHVSDARSGTGGLFRELDMAVRQWVDSYCETTPSARWKYDDLAGKLEAGLLRHLLAKFEGRPTHLAAALAMNRATLRQKIRRLLE